MQNLNKTALPQVGFATAVKNGFKNLFNFKGRIRRSEYWWYALVATIIGAAWLVGFFKVLEETEIKGIPFFLLGLLWLCLPVFLFMSAQVRRLHDTGKSGILPWVSYIIYFGGYLALIATSYYLAKNPAIIDNANDDDAIVSIFTFGLLIFLALQFAIFILALFDSDPDTNKYGPSPKYK